LRRAFGLSRSNLGRPARARFAASQINRARLVPHSSQLYERAPDRDLDVVRVRGYRKNV